MLQDIFTPFDKCQRFEPQLLFVIDDYLKKEEKLCNTHLHWFMAWGLMLSNNDAFIHACRDGELKAVMILSRYFPRNDNDNLGKSLQAACEYGHLEVVKYLVQTGVDIHLAAKNYFLVTNASKNGHLKIVKYLVNLGADATLFEDQPLRLASANGHIETVKYLVSQGANVRSKYHEVITLAAENGHLNLVEFFVDRGVDISKSRHRAFRRAVKNGHIEVVKYLVSKGADITVVNNYAIRSASFNGHLETVKYLVSLGADIHTKNNYAIVSASNEGHLDTVKYLFSVGAKMTKQQKYYSLITATEFEYFDLLKYLHQEQGFDILDNINLLMCNAAESGSLDIVKYLVSWGADCNAYQNEAFQSAVKNNDFEVVQYLMSKIHKDTFITKSKKFLEFACRHGHLDMFKYLMNCGADISTPSINTCLCLAAKNGHLNVVKCLIGLGAEFSAFNNTPLCSAAEYGNMETVKYLVDLKADITAQDNYAIVTASRFRYMDIVKYLLCKMFNTTDINHLNVNYEDPREIQTYLSSLPPKTK